MTLVNPLEHGTNFAVIALNNRLPHYFSDVWNAARLRICAGGGTNVVSQHFRNKGERDFLSPDAIIGNIKEIDRKISKEFESAGAQFVNGDGDDLTKSLSLLEQMNYKDPIMVLADFDGPFDKITHIIDVTLSHESLRIIMADDHNFTTWYRPGDKEILTPMHCTTKMCGLIPIAGPTSMKTEGLRWNLSGETLSMGEFISSSNEIAAPKIKIETDKPFLWTTEAKSNFKINKNK